MEHSELSFIIPAYNEEASLPNVLNSIKKYAPESLLAEVIVADNGSRDNTVAIAESHHAKVIIDKSATVGGLRNRAAKISKGKVLIFLDADIQLTKEWGKYIVDTYENLLVNPLQVTGSRCGIPANASWIEQFWFLPMLSKKVKYINSGHLITTQDLFWKRGGFNEELETGEDYSFGVSAANINAKIVNNPLLAVVHDGYPKTLCQFIKREVWHGKGDCRSFRSIMVSNVAVVSILLMMLHIIAIYGFFWVSEWMIWQIAILLICTICFTSALLKHKARTFKSIILVSSLYYFYFLSRFFSCVFISAESSRGSK